MLSFLLAQRFGGTPWEWRQNASECDWGTGLRILNDEMEEAQRG